MHRLRIARYLPLPLVWAYCATVCANGTGSATPEYYILNAEGAQEALRPSETEFVVQFRESSSAESRAAAIQALESDGFRYVDTQLIPGIAPARTNDACAVMWAPGTVQSGQAHSALARARGHVRENRKVIAGISPRLARANGRPALVSPGCILVGFSDSVPLDRYWQLLAKHGLVPFDSASPHCIRERYIQNVVRVVSDGKRANVFELIKDLAQQDGVTNVYPLLLRDLHAQVALPALSPGRSGQAIREFLQARGYGQVYNFGEILYVLERHGLAAAQRFGVDSRQIGSDTINVNVVLDGLHTAVPSQVLGAGLHAASEVWHDSVEAQLNSGVYQRRTSVTGWILLRDIPTLFRLPGVILVQPVVDATTVGQLFDNSCWVRVPCAPACTSKGLQFFNLQDWRQKGYFGTKGYPGSRQKVAIIDPHLGAPDLTVAYNRCGFDTTVNDTNKLFNISGAIGLQHGEWLAEVVSQVAPCAQLYLARVSPSNAVQSMSDIRTWLKDRGVKIAALAFCSPRFGAGDGSGQINSVINAMVNTDSVSVVVSAGNYATFHHESMFEPTGVMTYEWYLDLDTGNVFDLGKADSVAGDDPIHNFTQFDDDISFVIPDSNGTYQIALSWRDVSPDGLQTLWDFDLLVKFGANDDLVNISPTKHDSAFWVVTNNGRTDQKGMTGGQAWGSTFGGGGGVWPNVEVFNFRPNSEYSGPYPVRAQIMVENFVAARCEKPGNFADSQNCATLGQAYYRNPPFMIEVTVMEKPVGFDFAEEAKANRSNQVYRDTAGSIMCAPLDNVNTISVGAFSAAHSFNPAQGNYPRIEPYSSRGPGNEAFGGYRVDADLLAPDSVRLPGATETPGSCQSIFPGTSFSAPVVAGAVALIQEQYHCGRLLPVRVRDSLKVWAVYDSSTTKGWPPYFRLKDSLVQSYECGNVNGAGSVTSADVVYLIGYVLSGGPAPVPVPECGDANCSGAVTTADIIVLVDFVFKAGKHPCEVPPPTLLARERWLSRVQADDRKWSLGSLLAHKIHGGCLPRQEPDAAGEGEALQELVGEANQILEGNTWHQRASAPLPWGVLSCLYFEAPAGSRWTAVDSARRNEKKCAVRDSNPGPAD